MNSVIEPKGRHKLLAIAQELFLEKGYEGTSIGDIAMRANVNKSLVYYYYTDKADLWQAVKKNIVDLHQKMSKAVIEFPMDSFKNYLTHFVSFRFNLYDQNPEIARLIHWQILEKRQNELSGIREERFLSLVNPIKEFQRRGEIRQELEPDMVEYFILNSTSMSFINPPRFFDGQRGQEQRKLYLELLIDSLYRAFCLV